MLIKCSQVLSNDQQNGETPSGTRAPTSVRLGAVRVQAGAQAVRAHSLPLASGLQLGELPLQVPPLSFQNLHLVQTPPVRLLQFLGVGVGG